MVWILVLIYTCDVSIYIYMSKLIRSYSAFFRNFSWFIKLGKRVLRKKKGKDCRPHFFPEVLLVELPFIGGTVHNFRTVSKLIWFVTYEYEHVIHSSLTVKMDLLYLFITIHFPRQFRGSLFVRTDSFKPPVEMHLHVSGLKTAQVTFNLLELSMTYAQISLKWEKSWVTK